MTSSPHRSGGEGDANADKRPRFFDTKTKKSVGQKLTLCPAVTQKGGAKMPPVTLYANVSSTALAVSATRSESTADNCQILQSRVNRLKSNKDQIDSDKLRGYSCDINFTEKELDIIEMAVYGDVIRPGNQCRCRTVDEMLGKFKAKDNTNACKQLIKYNLTRKRRVVIQIKEIRRFILQYRIFANSQLGKSVIFLHMECMFTAVHKWFVLEIDTLYGTNSPACI
ncbi:hypothetical protein P8452_75403 [Trifolium repens]|nr:hypothetical protein P8452_75403 [Trifolium repens]